MSVRRSDLWSAWLRSFAVGGSWNYRTLLGSGIAYALLPVLRRVHTGDPVRMRRALADHLQPFNAHPYMAALAVGALARAERDGVERETIRRFRRALSGPLGSLGDRTVWARWRPFCLLVSLAAWMGLGFTPWTSVLLFLGLYNVGHLALRAWAFRTGWREGTDVAAALREWPPDRWSAGLTPVNALLLGAVAHGAARRAMGETVAGAGLGAWGMAAGVAAGAALAVRWPAAARRLGPLLFAGGALAGWLVGG